MSLTLNREDIVRLTDRIEHAQLNAKAIPKLTDDFPAMGLSDGYAVQMELRRRWLDEGKRQVGWKIGLTSKAKMLQMGVDVPSIGFLMADMARPESSAVRTDDLVIRGWNAKWPLSRKLAWRAHRSRGPKFLMRRILSCLPSRSSIRGSPGFSSTCPVSLPITGHPHVMSRAAARSTPMTSIWVPSASSWKERRGSDVRRVCGCHGASG